MFETWEIDKLTLILTAIIVGIPAILFLILYNAFLFVLFWICLVLGLWFYLTYKKKKKK